MLSLERHTLLIDFTVHTGGGRKYRHVALRHLCHAGAAGQPRRRISSLKDRAAVPALCRKKEHSWVHVARWVPQLTLHCDLAFCASEIPAFPLLAAQAADQDDQDDHHNCQHDCRDEIDRPFTQGKVGERRVDIRDLQTARHYIDPQQRDDEPEGRRQSCRDGPLHFGYRYLLLFFDQCISPPRLEET